MKIKKELKNKIKKRIIDSLKNPDAREVVIRTPFEMSEQDMSDMKASFPDLSKANLVNEVDSSLIGGLVIVDGSMILDYSVKGKLQNVVENILEN